jgi:predicted metal-dependent enzyme (double-stranded beta helix superfamily)
MTDIAQFRTFVRDFTRLYERADGSEAEMLSEGRELLAWLVNDDDWLPDAYAAPNPERYSQYLLWCDPMERFSIVSFVWGPGQSTPVHDHTVWGLIGMLRGAEISESFAPAASGSAMEKTDEEKLIPGIVGMVSPTIGDIHAVSNALPDQPSISIHVYGANIGAVARHTFDAATGAPKDFVSGYSAETLPNLWDRSAEVRASLD